MSLTPVRNLQLHNQVERVLHVPGNYRGGILEMAIVVDREFDKATARELCGDIITSCKQQSEVFRNVRLNMILWGTEEIRADAVASAYVQTGTYFDGYEEQKDVSCMQAEEIMEYLKKFHARSKLILLLTPDSARLAKITDPDRMGQAMNPFLKHKLIIVYPEKIEAGAGLYRSILS